MPRPLVVTRPLVHVRRAARTAAALLAGILALGGAPRPSPAQPVNTELLRRDPFAPGWSFDVQGSFALSHGNVDVLDVGAGGQVQFQELHPPRGAAADVPSDGAAAVPTGAPVDHAETPPFVRHRAFLRADGRFAERDDDTFVSQAFAHLRWTGMWHPRVGSELFAQYQYNRFLLLQARGLLGAGVRVEAVHHAAFLLAVGTGYMLELEQIDVAPGAPDDAQTLHHRWTSYLAARVALVEDRLLLKSVLYVQPRFDRLHDVRVLEEIELVVGVNAWLAFGTTLAVLHDSDPPTAVDDTDVRLTSTVRLSF